ncbi:hypothetical protein N0V90_010111 [Kalmusia sp. IMI 367209]|nr:hypothetical protein N0V90_010111 [Kalmusia sp. IMI 367209]
MADSSYWSERPPPTLLHNQLRARPLLATSASGIVINLEGKGPVIDASGGATAAIIGHGNKEVLEAVVAQMNQLSYVHTLAYTTVSAEALADFLISRAGNGFAKAYLVGSGSEANDSAMKLARQYFYEKGEKQRTHFISRRQAYHGNTMGAMSLTTALKRIVPYQDILPPNVSYVSPCYPYQYKAAGETDAAYVARLAQELDDEFERIGPSKVIAFVVETVSGSVAGCIPPTPGYFQAMKRVCEKHGALMILDEIMCGLGRTGSMFAWKEEGVVPDLTTIGKGLGAGYIPIAAVLAQKDIVDTIEQGSGQVYQSYTFQAHAVASAAALAVQKIVERDGLIENSKKMGVILQNLLCSRLGEKRFVGNIRGRGCFFAVEFVQDRATKESFDPNVQFGIRVQQRALDLGVHIYPGVGVVDGERGDHILLAPAIVVTEQDLEKIVSVVETAYDDVERDILCMQSQGSHTGER